MDETFFAGLRREVQSLQAQETAWPRRRGLMQLADALDRVLALLEHPCWRQHAAPWSVPERERARDALRELEQAVAQVLPWLPAALGADVGAAVTQLAGEVARRGGTTRSAGPAVPGAAVPPLVDSSASPPAWGRGDGPLADRVRFGAAAPQAVPPMSVFVARFLAYPDGQVERAMALLGAEAGNGCVEKEVGLALLQRGVVLEVALSGGGLRINGAERAVQRFVWGGEALQLTFGVEVAGVAAGSSTLLRFDVLMDGIVLAQVWLALRVGGSAPAAVAHAEPRAPARRAFASYSSRDRARVLDRVASIRLAAALKVFLDCLELSPGEHWKPHLEREIDESDIFLLFWSDAAAQSPWVRWEWERALATRGLERMQFHPLQNGVQPPRKLAAIHLADPYVDLRTAEQLRHPVAGA